MLPLGDRTLFIAIMPVDHHILAAGTSLNGNAMRRKASV